MKPKAPVVAGLSPMSVVGGWWSVIGGRGQGGLVVETLAAGAVVSGLVYAVYYSACGHCYNLQRFAIVSPAFLK